MVSIAMLCVSHIAPNFTFGTAYTILSERLEGRACRACWVHDDFGYLQRIDKLTSGWYFGDARFEQTLGVPT